MSTERQLLSKGNKKVVEKVENRGTFRIVGQVFQDATSKTALGYGVIDVKNFQLRLFTKKQTVELMRRYKFENAELDVNGKVVNTECSMDRLIKFDTNKNVIGNAGITILGQVILNGKDYGYRVLNQQGKVADITEETLLLVSKNGEGIPILNAKVIKEGVSKPYVSAIRGDFKRIELVAFEEMKNTYDSKSIKEAHAKFLNKQKDVFARKLVHYGFVKLTPSKSAKKATKILLSEYVIPTYPFLNKDCGLTVGEALTLAYLIEVSDGKFSKYSVGKFKKYSKNVAKRTTQFTKFSSNIMRVAKENGYDDVVEAMLVVNSIVDGNLKCITHETGHLKNNANLYDYVCMFINSKVKEQKTDSKTYNTAELDYESVQGVELLGYTVNKERVGVEVETPLYKKPVALRWVLEYIDRLPCDANFILDNINCFGDIELMRRVIKNIDDTQHFGSKQLRTLRAEAYLFVLACNNLTLAKYVNEMCGNFSKLPLEEINREKFALDSDDKIFYLSGGKFNRGITLKTGESWSSPNDGKGSLSNFTGGYFAAMSLYMTIDGRDESALVD